MICFSKKELWLGLPSFQSCCGSPSPARVHLVLWGSRWVDKDTAIAPFHSLMVLDTLQFFIRSSLSSDLFTWLLLIIYLIGWMQISETATIISLIPTNVNSFIYLINYIFRTCGNYQRMGSKTYWTHKQMILTNKYIDYLASISFHSYWRTEMLFCLSWESLGIIDLPYGLYPGKCL